MKILCISLIILMMGGVSGCNKTQTTKDQEKKRANIMGPGNLPMPAPGQSVGGI